MKKPLSVRTSIKILMPLLFFCAASGVFGQAINTDKILDSLDKNRNVLENDIAMVMTFISEDPEKGVEKNVVRQFRRDGDDKFLMIFQEPEVKKGQGYLRVDDNLWFYDPESRKFTHSSMKERFGGTDARNSDFGKSSLKDDYAVTSATEGKLGKYDVYILDLAAKNNEVTYAREKYWVTRDNYLLLKSEDYSSTGRLMRTSLFPAYTKVETYFLPTQMIFIDNLVEGKKTQISMTDISMAPLPETVFTKSYLERVNR